MAQPTKFVPSYDFSDYQTASPNDPLPGAQVDTQLGLVKTTTDEIIDNLALIQRDDGELANNSVGIDQLTTDVDIGLRSVTNWLTATAYVLRDGVWVTGKLYRCIVAHTSGTFATDLAAAKWELVLDYATASGLVIGTDVQAWDEDLDDIAALTPSAGDILQYSGGWTNVAGRRRLTADETRFLAASGGSDDNDGASSGAPWATFAKFQTYLNTLDLTGGYTVKLKFVNGTYTEQMRLRGRVFGQKAISDVILEGDTSTPGNVTISTTGAETHCFLITDGAWCQIQGFELISASGDAINTAREASVWFQNIEFGACGGDAQLYAAYSRLQAIGNYEITGGAARHMLAEVMSEMSSSPITVTVTGTPDFTYAFAVPGENSALSLHDVTWSGTATGKQYVIADGGVIVPPSILASIPGDVEGTDTTQPILRNLLYNPSFRVAQRGTSFTSATTPANSDDTYLLDRWILLSDGNDIVDVTQGTDGAVGSGTYIQLDVETTAKKFGILQILPNKDVQELLSLSEVVALSFRAKVSDAAKLSRIKCMVLSWSGTVDAPTSDIVDAWGAEGTPPTVVANWTIEGVSGDLGVTTSDWRYSLDNVSIDAASTKNLAVFIWSDDVATNDTAGSLLQITDVQLVAHPYRTRFESRPFGEELARCQGFYEKSYNQGVTPGTASTTVGIAFSRAGAAIATASYYDGAEFAHAKVLGTPAVTIYSFSGNTGRVSTAGGVEQGASSGVATFIGDSGFTLLNSSGSDITPGSGGFIYHWTAVKEL